MKTKSVMIVGVGGQGSLLASRILGHVFLEQGFDVKVSEVHGMSQRGGSVVTYIKYGDQVFSPIIEQGEADFLLSFEQLEAARWLPHLKKRRYHDFKHTKDRSNAGYHWRGTISGKYCIQVAADRRQFGCGRRFESGTAGGFTKGDKHGFNRHSLYHDALCKGELGSRYSGIGSPKILGFEFKSF